MKRRSTQPDHVWPGSIIIEVPKMELPAFRTRGVDVEFLILTWILSPAPAQHPPRRSAAAANSDFNTR